MRLAILLLAAALLLATCGGDNQPDPDAPDAPPSRAATVVRTLARVAVYMPIPPATDDEKAPAINATAVRQPTVSRPSAAAVLMARTLAAAASSVWSAVRHCTSANATMVGCTRSPPRGTAS